MNTFGTAIDSIHRKNTADRRVDLPLGLFTLSSRQNALRITFFICSGKRHRFVETIVYLYKSLERLISYSPTALG